MLYRDILRKPQLIDEILDKEKFTTALKKAMIFNINNVSEYFFSISKQDFFSVGEDFPNLAPPFPIFWMEYKFPETINIEGKIQKNGLRFPVGVLIAGEEGLYPGIAAQVKPGQEIKWTICASVVLGLPNKIAFMLNAYIPLTHDGRAAEGVEQKYVYGKQIHPLLAKEALSRGQDPSKIGVELFPALLAISFLHCKNVMITEVGRVKRQYHNKKKNREPETKIHILEIEPMKKILKAEGKAEETGLKQALHICRGHFKDFRQGPGLFGKFKDIYWWDSQVRGSSKYGEIRKDYNVNAPKDEA